MALSPFKVVSLFAGAGGKDLGFVRAGFKVIWANDVDPAACQTYRQNFDSPIVCADVRSMPSETIPPSDVVIGGFPCQGFSIVGTRRLDDERNSLYREMKRVIRDTQPAFFVAENVRGLLNLAGGKVAQAILGEFREIGYQVDCELLNAADFGVPQNRERVIILGNRLGLRNPFPKPTHGAPAPVPDGCLPFEVSPLLSRRTLRDAIGNIEQLGGLPNHEIPTGWISRHPSWLRIMRHIGEGQKLCNVRLGPRSVYTWDIPEVFGPVTSVERSVLVAIAGNRRRRLHGEHDGNPLSFSTIVKIAPVPRLRRVLDALVRKDYLVYSDAGYELKNAFNGIFRRLRWDAPSEAVLTVFDSPRYYLHPSQQRPFSVREAARIQGFPDDFVFCGTLTDQYTQVGNAVPPTLAEGIAGEILKVLTAANTSSTIKDARPTPLKRVRRTRGLSL